VNWLLDFAGFAQATCDGYGSVILRPYANPVYCLPTVTLHDDNACIFRSGVVRERDLFDIPNVVAVTRTNASGDPLVATAINDDPASAFSTVSRKRRIVSKETVSDVEDQQALQAKADALLAAKTSVAEGFEIAHSYLPLDMGDVCDFIYRRAGIQHSDLVAVRQSMKLSPGMECTTRFRRFARS
ncbi:hypothetical protein, partial [Gordonibacter sp.]|uniref:hypothetical protein n=1 Tax=Gordonibacter sp. TaxID=1968902 RepID=UPI002FC619DD